MSLMPGFISISTMLCAIIADGWFINWILWISGVIILTLVGKLIGLFRTVSLDGLVLCCLFRISNY